MNSVGVRGADVIVDVKADGTIAVAIGWVPSGHILGGITYVNPSEQHIPPGGMHAK